VIQSRQGRAAEPRKLWASGVSIAAEASAAAAEEARRKVVQEECDLFDGKWVWDDAYPLYESLDCPFLDVGFRYSENGRPDSSYTKCRWQPARCDLPRLVLVPACSIGGWQPPIPIPFPSLDWDGSEVLSTDRLDQIAKSRQLNLLSAIINWAYALFPFFARAEGDI
jgi:hypothetical protein